MSDPAMPLRRLLSLPVALFALGLLTSCATKKEGAATPKPAAQQEEKATPTPSPSPAPAPEPTPQARYFARASVEGEEAPLQELTPDGKPTPSPSPTPASTPGATPAPSPTPAPKPGNVFAQTWQKFFPPQVKPSPSPAARPKSENLLTQAWQKIFPPKAQPAPTPGPTGRLTARVTTPEGTQETILREGEDLPPDTMMAPTPIPVKLRPTEDIFSRTWHMIFPKKQEPPPATLPQWIGTIKLVNEREGYALIDSQQGYYAMPDEEILNAIGGGSESGVLRVTADRNPPFFIADIVGGKPRAGDRVYSPKP